MNLADPQPQDTNMARHEQSKLQEKMEGQKGRGPRTDAQIYRDLKETEAITGKSGGLNSNDKDVLRQKEKEDDARPEAPWRKR